MISIEQLKERKKELGITFDELSEKSGIPKTTLTNILCGKTLTPRIDTMQAIENALGLCAPQWTDEEKALGVGNHKTVLSDEEWTRQSKSFLL